MQDGYDRPVNDIPVDVYEHVEEGHSHSHPVALPPGDTALLEVHNISVSYGRTVALRQVNLRLGPGQIVGVIGPNGAGKSTLLKAILGIVPHSGVVTINGQPRRAHQTDLAYVPQKEDVAWDFPVTVWDVVMMGRTRRIGWFKGPRRRDKEVVATALAQVGMADLHDRQISQLSGGQQQRVFVARALAQEGTILLLDEPLTGVDAGSQAIIMNLLGNLRDAGVLVIMATHDLSAARTACNCCACINHALIALGPPHDVFTPAVLARTYGGKALTVPTHDDGAATVVVE